MSPILRRLLFLSLGCALAAAVSLSAADVASPSEVKRITDRYALTGTRIHSLLDQRLNPKPLPANPPNPFYQLQEAIEPVVNPDVPVVPEFGDISDGDLLKKSAPLLKLGGVIIRNGTAYLTINNMPTKAGDVITVGHKDHPTYLKIVALTPTELTLGLNEATLAVPLKK